MPTHIGYIFHKRPSQEDGTTSFFEQVNPIKMGFIRRARPVFGQASSTAKTKYRARLLPLELKIMGRNGHLGWRMELRW